ncbi:MAG: hypothetical protein CMB80_21815 [Flammeovirgaceae bacterium]|nr:hypothetical protein [Flammeovirgaceae bacterium]HCX21696.1 hypothetical protein [Cytophagales bacterium]|tara:strand:- start:825 stop:2945 length:2121 start_codon:yes stop_codon:yes gene_type:complete
MKYNLCIAFIICAFFNVHSQQFDFYGPEPFDQILERSYQRSWTPTTLSDFENLSYVLIMDQSKTKVIAIDAENSSTSLKTIDFSNSTYGEVLRSIFQMVDINVHEDNNDVPLAGEYQLKPFLHSYFALNSSSSDELIPADAGTMIVADATESGYVLIEFGGTTENATIKSSSQWEYNNGTFTENTSWTTKWLTFGDNSNLIWVENEASAASFYLADADNLFNLIIQDGSNFNPNSTAYQSNATAELPDDATDIEESKLLTELEQKLDESVTNQLGSSSDATSTASATLDEIESTMAGAGLSMRYPKEFYLAARSAMLEQVVASSDIYGARLGYRTVPHVYFTNATDDSGSPHPFMVITSHAVSARPNQLVDVDRPPGAEQGVGYAETTVTRHGKLGEFMVKIPIRDYGLIDNLFDNDLSAYNDLASDYDSKEGTSTTKTVYNYTSLVSNGIAIDGVTIYPAQNNNLRFAVEDAEVTHSGIHVGGGLELHYHADGHAFNGNGINLYNFADYEGHDHPPVIGFAYDGIALFGRYEDNYPMTGDDIALDKYGGHDHGDGFGYHYHAHDEIHTTTLSGDPFTEHFLLVGAWKGQINDIPGFLEVKTNQTEDQDIQRYVGVNSDTPPQPNNVLATKENEITIYPNPASNEVSIVVNELSVVQLLNIRGNILHQSRVAAGDLKLSIKHLSPGIYFIRLYNGKETQSKKLIIK